MNTLFKFILFCIIIVSLPFQTMANKRHQDNFPKPVDTWVERIKNQPKDNSGNSRGRGRNP